MKTAVRLVIAILAALPPSGLSAQVEVDQSFDSQVTAPAFATGSGPLVLIDEAHHNAHTMNGRYAPFAALLRNDGFRVEPLKEPFTTHAVQRAKIVVIANASASETPGETSFPVTSAFPPSEIEALTRWVRGGGSLLLVADHPPWAGAAVDLANAFGVYFANGYAMREPGRFEPFFFRTSDGSLVQHAITRGRRGSEKVSLVVTFTGQAFRAPGLDPLLVLYDDVFLFLPERLGELTETTPRIRAGRMLQAAVGRYGRGRVAIFGEAAMFSAQLLGPKREPLGMNHPDAPQNKQFTLNVARWLAGRLR